MKNKTLRFGFGLCLFAFGFLPVAVLSAFTGSTVNITGDGVATVSGARVMQLAGSSFYTRLYWGDSFVRLLVKTTSNTKFKRGTGETTTVSEISVGDMIDMSGQLESGSESLVLVADAVRDSTVQKEQASATGKVTAVDVSSGIFTLNSPKLGTITVATNGNTTFIKGSRTLDIAHVKVGDTITKTSGDYDLPTKTLTATKVVTYVDPNFYKPQNFQGTLQSVSGTSLPASITVSIGNTSYVVNLTVDTAILNKNKSNVLLSRYVAGDTVRLYGTIREIDDPIIDAQVIRNMSL